MELTRNLMFMIIVGVRVMDSRIIGKELFKMLAEADIQRED